MKTKFVRNARTNRRELIVVVQRSERLEEKRAKVLAADSSTLLLPFSYEISRSGTLLHYDVEGLWSLKTFLAKRKLGVEELMGLLQATQGVLDLCGEKRLKTEGLFFDPEFVFVNAQCCPRFVQLTLEELPLQERNSPLTLLKALSDVGSLRFATPDAEGLSRRLAAYVIEQGGVFSANTFRRYVEGEERELDLGASESEEPRATVGQSTSSSWATAGTTRPAAAPEGNGVLFWNPLMGMAGEEEAAQPASSKGMDAAKRSVTTPAYSTPDPAPQPVVEPALTASLVEPVVQPVVTPQPTVAPAPVSIPRREVVSSPASQPAVTAVPTPAPQPVRSAYLVRASSGEQYPLRIGAQVKLGRGSGCDIRLLGNPRFSRTHAAIACDGQQVHVTDLGAANGVWVNGMRLAPNQTMATSVGQTFRLANEDVYVRIG